MGAYKVRSIQYGKRDGKPRIEYWIVDLNGVIKTAAPRVWHHIDMPDMTTLSKLEECAKLRYTATRTQLRDMVDDNAALRAERDAGRVKAGMEYHWLCAQAGITV